jgi:uncharacterized protein YndB with AHSA1/START domain
MRGDLLYSDRPVAPPQGSSVTEPVSDGLRFSRSYRAPLEAVTERWTNPLLRQVWLKPMIDSRFAITLASPAYLEAHETDGVCAVQITITFEDDGEFTTVNLAVAPCDPITPAMLIASGYADHWEERLYALADQLNT